MRYTILLGFLAVLLSSCDKEISPVQAEKFVKYYGSYLMVEAGEVEVLDDGGFAICGTMNSSGSGKRMALILTDKFGNMKSGFPLYYEEEGLETGASSMVVIQGGSGGFLLSGFVERPVGGSQSVQKDIFLVRANASGAELWQRSYGSGEDEQILHSVERNGSGFLLTGSQMKNGRSNILVMGVTEEGDSIRLGLNYPNPNARNSTANYLLNTGRDYLCVSTVDKVNADGTDILVLTFEDDLSPLIKKLSGEHVESGQCIVGESDNRYLVLGNRVSTSGRIGMVIYAIEKDGLFITGTEELATISESNADLIGKRMIKTSDGRFAIVGTRVEGGNSHIFLQFLSSAYSVEEQISFGASGVQAGYDLDVGSDRGIVLLGTNNAGSNNILSLIKTSETGEL